MCVCACVCVHVCVCVCVASNQALPFVCNINVKIEEFNIARGGGEPGSRLVCVCVCVCVHMFFALLPLPAEARSLIYS